MRMPTTKLIFTIPTEIARARAQEGLLAWDGEQQGYVLTPKGQKALAAEFKKRGLTAAEPEGKADSHG